MWLIQYKITCIINLVYVEYFKDSQGQNMQNTFLTHLFIFRKIVSIKY